MSSVRRILSTVVLGAAMGATVGVGPAAATPAPAQAQQPSHALDHQPPPPGPGRGVQLSALLTGRQEVPGPGDPNGWGAASVRVWPAFGRICYTLVVRRVDPRVNAAHIHFGRRGVAGPIRVSLNPPVWGVSRGCTTVNRMLAWRLATSPNWYYVNVHSVPTYPLGAVRGQLRRTG